MKAIGYLRSGDSSVLEPLEVAVPDPAPRDLIVQIRAVSVNPVDVKLRAKAAPKDGKSRILGFDAAGIVTAIGSAVTLFHPGDAVYHAGSVVRPGTNAEFHAVDERIVGAKPVSLSFEAAAALPLTAITAWELLFDRLRVDRGTGEGDVLLVVNGAGGVGSILIQLARQLTGLTVIATASRVETRDWVRAMGAHHVVDHRQPVDESVRALGIAHVKYVAGLTATDRHLPAIAKLIAPHGVLALIDDPPSLDIVPLRAKAVSVAWEGMFVRSQFATPDMIAQHHLLNEVSALVDAGAIRSTIHDRFGSLSSANLARAHDHVASGTAIGKSVLSGIEV